MTTDIDGILPDLEEDFRKHRRKDKSTRHEDLGRVWKDIQMTLPSRHTLMVSGPRLDGTWWAGVIDTRRGSRQVISARGTLIRALTNILKQLDKYEPEPATKKAAGVKARMASVTTTPQRDAKGRFLPRPVPTDINEPPAVVGKPTASSDKAVGFTRNRDVVAYLIGKAQRVSQYELREVYGIKNPAQAVNEFEEQYHVTLTTGKKTENGDIFYTLAEGKLPEIAGMLPMFIDGIEDPDDRLYVNTLSLYLCRVCGRSPVYKPRQTHEASPFYGICPRHGPQEFDLF